MPDLETPSRNVWLWACVYSLNVSQWEIKFLWSALRFTVVINIIVVLQHQNDYKNKQKS